MRDIVSTFRNVSTEADQAHILNDEGALVFNAGAWSGTLPELAVFDSTFVSENVFSGDSVDIDHRRSLYRVIVGKEGVALAKQIEQLDEDSRAKASEIKEKAAPIQIHVPKGMTLDAFIELQEDPAIDAKSAEKERELEALRQADQIRNRAALSSLTLPALPAGFQDLLARTVEGVAEDAGQRVAAQIQTHAMHGRGETWLSEGLGYVSDDRCPFCAQDLAPAANLIAAYRAYFSQAYNDLRKAITAMRLSIQNALGDKQIADLEKTIDQNAAGVEFWSRFCDIVAPASPDGAGDKLRALRQAALALLDRKAAAPLEQIVLDATFTDARDAVSSTAAVTATHNAAVAAANAIINAKKAATGAADVKTVETALAALRLTKKRHEPDMKKACSDYRQAQADKAKIEEEKQAAKKKLDEYTEKVIGKCEQAINRFLEDFNAGFRITDTRHAYPGGVASSSYQILINSTPIDLGDSKTPLDKPSFRNTLSSGDRSTLALAFFLAQIEDDPDKASRIVIFDDPFNSQDSFRKDCTRKLPRQADSSQGDWPAVVDLGKKLRGGTRPRLSCGRSSL